MMTTPLQRLREWSALLPLLLLLAATYWLNQQVQPLPPKPDAGKRHDPDFIISKFSATTLNEQGVPHFLVSAQKMMHYPDDDSTHLDEPQLSSVNADRPPVYAFARQGEVSSKGDEIFLRDDVKLVRAASATQSEMTFTTTYLHVIPDRDLADTDRPVTMTDAHNIVHAVGMQFDNKARKMKLLAQVRSQHDPAK
ncbi:MAG: LPS export ABC transporter periplasmic protein LptC [Betaproteobacteria bacterium]|nr:LPS export ABC transporter periplasmic protein LptC [Betaproteobacteria bacterium]